MVFPTPDLLVVTSTFGGERDPNRCFLAVSERQLRPLLDPWDDPLDINRRPERLSGGERLPLLSDFALGSVKCSKEDTTTDRRTAPAGPAPSCSARGQLAGLGIERGVHHLDQIALDGSGLVLGGGERGDDLDRVFGRASIEQHARSRVGEHPRMGFDDGKASPTARLAAPITATRLVVWSRIATVPRAG